MMMTKSKGWGLILLLLLIIGAAFLWDPKKETATDAAGPDTATVGIDLLTSERRVLPYVRQHGRLPDYYIRKGEARKQGWNPAEGNLCEVLPGKAIGGDRFSNREGALPTAAQRQWFEADLNYQCGRRNADRLVFSSDGLLYVTKDHYKTFQQQ